MEHHGRHVKVWNILRPIVELLVNILFNCKTKKYRPQGPYLVLANHVTDLDPLIVGASFPQQMYFVTSEHLMRQGFISKVLEWLLSPITRQKGGNAAGTVKAILRHLKAGYNVCFFPEGNRSWDGVTRAFPEATGKLARSGGCTLVTYRINGGYFSSPRWSGSSLRRGKLSGEVVGMYSPQELRAMSADEINRLIARDLYVDAYAQQQAEPVSFKGSKLAENLETLIFTCPKCGAMHRMESRGNKFFCLSCGMETEYTATGFFSGGELPFDNVRDWNAWQEEQIRTLCENAGDEVIFSDSEMELYTVSSGKGKDALGKGDVHLYADRLELPGGVTLKKEEISGMSMRGAMVLYIGASDGRHYELRSEKTRCTVKYLSACACLGCAVGVGV